MTSALNSDGDNAAAPLSVRNLTKHFGKVRALAGVSLDIPQGGVIALLGKNGAGKTTLIRCALGLEKASGGAVQVFHDSAGSMASRQRTGVMLQDSELPDLLSAREFLTLFSSYYPAPLPLDEVIELTDIGAFADKRYKKLSGGQKRRVQFALAVVGDPDLVFLDEPTTGLDTDARKALWAVVRRFSEAGKTIVLSTHYLEEADTLADRIIILGEGRIIADAPTDEIRSQLGGAVIRCHTKLSESQLLAMSACTGVRSSGRYSDIESQDTVATLRDLLLADDALSDLTVSKPRLEDIFSQLTNSAPSQEQ